MKKRGTIFFLSSFLISCGSSPSATVRLLPSTTGQNPITEVQALKVAGASRGFYFQFYALKSPPVSMDDVASPDAVLTSPSERSPTGSDATEAEFSIDTSTLNPNTFYKITLVAISTDPASTVTHRGNADCPLILSIATRNNIKICFARVGEAPVCSGTTPAIGQCPAP